MALGAKSARMPAASTAAEATTKLLDIFDAARNLAITAEEPASSALTYRRLPRRRRRGRLHDRRRGPDHVLQSGRRRPLGPAPVARRGVVRFAAPLPSGRTADAPRRVPDGRRPQGAATDARRRGRGGTAGRDPRRLHRVPDSADRPRRRDARRGQRAGRRHRTPPRRGGAPGDGERAPRLERGQGRIPRARLA